MTKAVSKAMDAVQKIIAKEKHISIDKFTLAGASKRGWTAWLTTLVDARVNAVIPIVIDILNTHDNLKHIYYSYNKSWPAHCMIMLNKRLSIGLILLSLCF